MTMIKFVQHFGFSTEQTFYLLTDTQPHELLAFQEPFHHVQNVYSGLFGQTLKRP